MVTVTYNSLGVIDHNGEPVGDSITLDDGVVVGFSRTGYSKVVEVDGYILPGFIDAHLHIKGLGAFLQSVNLRGVTSREELVRLMSSSKMEVVVGRGWDQEAFPDKKPPSRRDLDRAVPDRPAVAIRICGHMAVANSRALEETKPWMLYSEYVDRENGVLYEDAVYYTVNSLLARLDEASMVWASLGELRASGIAGVSSMACSSGEIEALRRLDLEKGLPVKVACYASHESFEGYKGVSTKNFTVVGVKLFADGSLGARTAYLKEPYNDDPGTRGKMLLSSRDIKRIAGEALNSGFRVAIHAIGDAALDEVLEAYEELNPGGRARIEHASVSWPGQIRRMAELGVAVVVQPSFRKSDWWLDRRLGARAERAYRFREMLSSGVFLAASTDAPVEDYRPWETFRVAMGDCGDHRCRYGEDLSPRDVIRMYTVNAARASGSPLDSLGRIERGLRAYIAYTKSYPLSSSWRGPLKPLNF